MLEDIITNFEHPVECLEKLKEEGIISNYFEHLGITKMSSKYPKLVIQAFLNPKKLAKCPTYAECSWGCIRNMIEATCKKYKRHYACKNNTVVNTLVNNKQIYVK